MIIQDKLHVIDATKQTNRLHHLFSSCEQQKMQSITPSSICKKKSYHSGSFTKALYITAFIYPLRYFFGCMYTFGKWQWHTNALEKAKRGFSIKIHKSSIRRRISFQVSLFICINKAHFILYYLFIGQCSTETKQKKQFWVSESTQSYLNRQTLFRSFLTCKGSVNVLLEVRKAVVQPEVASEFT